MTNRTTLIAVVVALVGSLAVVFLGSGGDPQRAGGPADAGPAAPARRAATDRAATDPTAAAPQPSAAPVARAPVASTATTGSLSVDVRWPEGDPAPGVAITFRTASRGLPARTLLRAVADDRGRILSGALPAGPLRLRSDRGGDLEVDVEPGRDQDLVFTLPEGIAVTGTVVDRRGRPVAAAGVWLQTSHIDWTAGRVVARCAADGSFALRGIPPGLSLGAVAAGFAPSALVDLDAVDTSAPPVAVRLMLEDGAGAVEGRVTTRGGEPVPRATLAFGKRPRSLDHRIPDQWTEKWTVRTATSDEDGRFELAGIAAGTSPVNVRADGFGLWRGEVVVRDGGRAWLDVSLGEAVTIAGTVRDQDGQPLAGAVIRAYDRPPRTPFIVGGQIDFGETFGYAAAECDAHGRYRLTGATPGTVRLVAQRAGERVLDRPLPFARTTLEAEPGTELEWSPVISDGRTIEGIVRYADGQPMGNVFITARDEQGGPQHVQTSDAAGRFLFVCLEGASYSLHVQYWSPPEGAPPLEQAGVIPDRGPVELRAPFAKPPEPLKGVVTGRIVDAGARVVHQKALRILLVSEKRWWRATAEIADGAFRFDGVAPGRYRLVAMSADDAIAHGDWFEVGAAELRDAGVLTTGPPGTVVIRLERGEGAESLEPVIYLRQEGLERGSKIAMGRRSEARLTNLTPAKYAVSGHAEGMVSVRGDVEVRVGEETELRLPVRVRR